MNTPQGIQAQGAVLAGIGLPLNDERHRQLDLPDVVSGANPLVAAANPVLNLVPQIRNLLQLDDPGRLRQYLIERIKGFERDAQQRGVPPDTIIGAR